MKLSLSTSHGGFSVLKTMVTMLGKVYFSSIFAQNVNLLVINFLLDYLKVSFIHSNVASDLIKKLAISSISSAILDCEEFLLSLTL